jgi:YidC/Oxa1 family membrane protein insertase
MDRRTLVALILTAIVIVVTPLLFPSSRRTPATRDSADTVASAPAASARATTPPDTARARSVAAPSPRPSSALAQRAETVSVRTNRGQYDFTTPGATPVRVRLPDYRSLTPGASTAERVDLVPPGERLVSIRAIVGRDTIAFDTIPFSASPPANSGSTTVASFASTSPIPITLTYRMPRDSFAISVEGTIPAAPAGSRSAVLISLPSHVQTQEANLLDDTRHFAFGYKRSTRDAQSVSFHDLDTAVTRVDTGAFRWVAERNKYFVIALVGTGADSAFHALYMRGAARVGRDVTAAHAAVLLPVRGNHFAFRVYAGPQSWDNLRATAPDLENVNPYGGWLHGVVQPFATIVMRLLLWMRRTFHLEYGWVLVLFGILVRLLLWPLNQNAMRSSMKMQRIQPELTELQKKYRNDPERQRDAMLKLYSEHGMSPFTPVLGCLPMLLPMPILFALYFVFQNTIELRGVHFLWLPDLSLRDPLFITPLFMGASMFVLSWIGMRGMPPSPQGKMMSYVMPVMFTVLFWNFASGLNLYYAVQNIAALPQQWLLARERVATGPPGPPASTRVQGTGRERG